MNRRRSIPLLQRLLAVLGLGFGVVHAAPVEVVGLFKDRAVVRVGGGSETLIRVGETSATGVTLLSADAHSARVRFEGEVYRVNLSNRVGGMFRPVEKNEIAISPDSLGQYRIRGAINNHFVNFLVDTGASVVAMSANAANSLGIDYRRGRPGSVQTAQGVTESFFVHLEQVNVGGITVRNVEAAVILGSYPTEILLGMSYLKAVGMREQAGVLTLTQKH